MTLVRGFVCSKRTLECMNNSRDIKYEPSAGQNLVNATFIKLPEVVFLARGKVLPNYHILSPKDHVISLLAYNRGFPTVRVCVYSSHENMAID